MNNPKKIITVFFSLLVTPILLFVSTSNKLFIINQADLSYDSSVLDQFLILAGVTILVGAIFYLFYKLAPSIQLTKYILWCYFLCGPLFMVYTSLSQQKVLPHTTWGKYIVLFSLIIIIFLFSRKIKIEKLVLAFALWGGLLLCSELLFFSLNVEKEHSNITHHSLPTMIEKHSRKDLPNIYVLLLDEFQTDMFTLTLNNKVRKALAGFIYFQENTAIYGRTYMSIPSIFSGLEYATSSSQNVYKKESLSSNKSILYWLKKQEYTTYAFVRDDIRKHVDLSLFDTVIEHQTKEKTNNIFQKQQTSIREIFRDLWIAKNIARSISKKILGDERVNSLLSRNVLSQNAGISSYYGFNNYIKEEKYLPANNRFTFLYLLMPHFPYIFNEDCSFSKGLSPTSPLSQSICTSNLITKFVTHLKEIGRYKNSLIFILSDHGARFNIQDGNLINVESKGFYSPEWSKARSRALLLVKPQGRGAEHNLLISQFESTLLDVTQTIATAIKLNHKVGNGIPLGEHLTSKTHRTRHYYYYDKKDEDGWTNQMTQFTIKGTTFKKKLIPLPNNKKEDFIPYKKRI